MLKFFVFSCLSANSVAEMVQSLWWKEKGGHIPLKTASLESIFPLRALIVEESNLVNFLSEVDGLLKGYVYYKILILLFYYIGCFLSL